MIMMVRGSSLPVAEGRLIVGAEVAAMKRGQHQKGEIIMMITIINYNYNYNYK